MKPLFSVVDYGMGNLRSVEKALQSVGARTLVTDSPAKIHESQAIVLPGVGSFGEAVRRLRKARLWESLHAALSDAKPFLGICLGLQLLLERSEESPKARGLGFLKGSVVRFPAAQKRLKVPHIGWNRVRADSRNVSPWKHSVEGNRYFYFVHSYFPEPAEKHWIASTTEYGRRFCSAVAGPSLLASQFHPEKSGEDGMRFLKHFVTTAEAAC